MFGKGFILREENDMIIKSVNLETVCGITSKLPDNTLPEVAFAGKSNVGKSSLINALMNRKSYARISAQPGKTQTINYYNINEELYYVDLPGYGFAKVTQSVKEKWGHMIEPWRSPGRSPRSSPRRGSGRRVPFPQAAQRALRRR